MRFLFISVFLLLLPAPVVGGESAIQCHCFQERRFDPSAPEKVTPYLLATAQNSFLSTYFGVEKSQVVRRRMSGDRAEDLWVAFYVAKKKGRDPAALLSERFKEGSWKTALLKGGVRPADLDASVSAAMTGGNDQTLATAIADHSISRGLGIKRPALAALRTRGATTQEIVLAVLLAQRSGRPAEAIWSEVKAGEATWGGLTTALGIRIGEMEQEFAKGLRGGG